MSTSSFHYGCKTISFLFQQMVKIGPCYPHFQNEICHLTAKYLQMRPKYWNSEQQISAQSVEKYIETSIFYLFLRLFRGKISMFLSLLQVLRHECRSLTNSYLIGNQYFRRIVNGQSVTVTVVTIKKCVTAPPSKDYITNWYIYSYIVYQGEWITL